MAKRKNSNQILINYVQVKPPRRDRADIDRWRQAQRTAEIMHIRKPLYDLYFDILLDAHLKSLIEKRIYAITNSKLSFFNEQNQPVTEVNQIINTTYFETLLREIINTRLWGFTLLELDWGIFGYDYQNKTYLIPREHVKPHEGIVVRNPFDDTGISFIEHPLALWSGNPDDLGLLLQAVPLVLLKRANWGDWADFLELFGQPFVKGSYLNDQTRDLIQQAFDKAGFPRWIVAPDDAKIDYTQGNTAGATEFNNFRKAINEELSILILGQTLTSSNTDTGSYSLGQIHHQVEQSIHEDDRQFVLRVLNERLIPILQYLGYPVQNGKFQFVDTTEMPLERRIQIDMQLATIVPIDDDYWYEKYKIPKPKKTQQTQTPISSKDIPRTENKTIKPKTAKSPLIKKLINFFRLKPFDRAYHHPSIFNLAYRFDHYSLAQRFWNNPKKKFDAQLFFYTYNHLSDAVHKGLKRTAKIRNIDYPDTETGYSDDFDDITKLMFELNIAQFSAAKTIKELQEINRVYKDAESFDDFQQKLQALDYKYNKVWLETEYSTAYSIAVRSAEYIRHKKNADIMPYWQYKTAGDDKVREAHRKLDGIILEHTDKRWKEIYPPNGWNCRCYVRPLSKTQAQTLGLDKEQTKKIWQNKIKSFFSSVEYNKMKQQGWNINHAELNVIFTKNQFYIKRFPGKAAKYLKDLKFTDYDLKHHKTIFPEKQLPIFQGDVKQWFEQNVFSIKKENDKLYRYRPIKINFSDKIAITGIIEEKNFYKHAQKTGRSELINGMELTLMQPDEIWFNKANELRKYQSKHKATFDKLTFIKYFKKQEKTTALIVVAYIDNKKYVEIKTWFKAAKPEILHKYRYGILLAKSQLVSIIKK